MGQPQVIMGWEPTVNCPVGVLVDVRGGPGESLLTVFLDGQVIALDDEREAVAVRVERLRGEDIDRGHPGLWFHRDSFINTDMWPSAPEVFLAEYFAQYEGDGADG